VPVGKTVPELGEMRAVFYTVGHDVPVRSSGLLDSFLSRSARMKGTENTYENYRPIIFYDVAGETFIDNLLALQRHYLVADKVAFVVNAGSLFPMVKPGNAASGEPTIEAADPAAIVTAMSQIDRLRTMPNAPEWCLVITQMDKFRLTFGEEQWSRIEFFAENESIDPYAGTSSNGTPLELLKESPTCSPGWRWLRNIPAASSPNDPKYSLFGRITSARPSLARKGCRAAMGWVASWPGALMNRWMSLTI
jgi:hypothetical protein